jgi:hypothetical protein
VSKRIQESRWLVKEIESLDAGGWEALCRHDKAMAFMKEYMVAKCVLDFPTFFRVVYHNALHHYYWPLHGEQGLTGYLQNWTREHHGDHHPVNVKFVVWAREHCKTQTVIAWDAWQFVRDVNARGLIRAFNDAKASEILCGVRELIESDVFRRNFPWVKPKTRGRSKAAVAWANDRFLLDRGDTGVRVMSMEAVGMKGDVTGAHFNFGHYDDFEVQDNANSEVLRTMMFDRWRNDSNLFMANSKRVFCGTPWSRKGIIYSVMKFQEPFADHPYDISVQPATVRVHDAAYSGTEPILLGDRRTIRDTVAAFPTIESDLVLCQARVRFFSQALGDTVEETREVIANSGNTFTVNRPFPEMLGQPISYIIGTEKPACPNRFTLDAVDLLPDDDGTSHARKSLVEKKRDQGPMVYSSQMDLDPADPEGLILNPEWLKVIRPEDIPDGDRYWYRAVDFAGATETAAATVMTTCFTHKSGLYVAHIARENSMSNLDKILELLVGTLRVIQHGGRLEWTMFEKALIEATLAGFLVEAERDPYEFFRVRPGYEKWAEGVFKESGPVHIAKNTVSRGGFASKSARIASQQPLWATGQVHVVVGPGWVSESALDVLTTEARFFRMDRNEPFDVLDTMADLCTKAHIPREGKVSMRRDVGRFAQVNRQAALRNALAQSGRCVVGGWPPRY